MPIAGYKIDRDIREETVAVETTDFETSVINNEIEPIANLLRYVEGSEWTVDYFHQILDKDDPLLGYDSSLPDVLQQYLLIKDFTLRVLEPLSTELTETNNQSTTVGTSLYYGTIRPYVGDMFSAEILGNITALLEVQTVDRKAYQKQTVFEITYKVLAFLTDKNDPVLLDIADKVTKIYHYDKDKYLHNVNPLLTTTEHNTKLTLQDEYDSIVDRYLTAMIDHETKLLIVPDQDTKIFDPYIQNFILRMVNTTDSLVVPDLFRVYPTVDSNTHNIFTALLNKNLRMLDYCDRHYGIKTPSLNCTSPELRTIAFLNVDYLVNLTDDVNMTTDSSMIATANTINNPNLVTPTPNVADVPDFITSGCYLFTCEFYNKGTNLTGLETLVIDYLSDKNLDINLLRSITENSYYWSTLQRYYYLPIVLFLIKYALSSAVYGSGTNVPSTEVEPNILITPTLVVNDDIIPLPTTPTMSTSGFILSSGTDTHVSTDWVIETTLGVVVWSSIADTVDKLTITVPSGILTNGVEYVFKVRYNGSLVSSDYASGTYTIIGLPVINTPTLIVGDEPNDITLTPTLTTSQFTLDTGSVTDTHVSTDWEISRGNGNLIWASIGNTVDLTNITVPSGILSNGIEYDFKVRHNGSVVSSDYVVEHHTVISINAWSLSTVYPLSTFYHTQSTLSDGRVLVVGGYDTTGHTNLAHIYDPVTGVWTSAANYPTVIATHSQSTLLDGRVLVVGGLGTTGSTNRASIYDPTTDVWTSAANYPTSIASHSQSTLSDGRVLVVGGLGTTGHTNLAHIYDPVTDVWISAANYPTVIGYHTQSTLPDGSVLVVGGYNTTGRTNLAHIYNPATNTWPSAANYPAVIGYHTQSTLLNGKVLVVGGHTHVETDACNIYDPVANTWTTVSPYLTTNVRHTQSTLLNGKVLVVGGRSTGHLNTTAIYTL